MRSTKTFLMGAVLLLAALARADVPRLVVLPLGQGEGSPDAAPGRFTAQVIEELKSRDDTLEVVPGPALKPSAPERSARPGKPSGDATAALEAGKKALADLKFEEAAAQLRRGIDLSLADPATADYPALLEAHISLAVAAFRMGDEREAQQTMLALARMDPNYSIPSGYPPAFSREFDRARKKLEKQAKGSLSVEGPAGSTVYIDGRDLGMVPVLEENLASGVHYVKIEGSRGERFGQAVELKGGMVKVRGSFSADGKSSTGGGAADPRVGSSIDEATGARVLAYVKAAGADFALVGIVYRTGDNQLTAGTALYSAKKQAFASLPAISFDSDALTSNVEAFKLVEEVIKRVGSFGAASSLPLSLLSKPAVKASANATTASRERDVETVTPTRKPAEALTPKDTRGGTAVVVAEPPVDEPAPGEVKKGVPTWVWVVVGCGAAAGAAVGGYFIIHEATRPVTGTVSASW